jgi:WD40 repeat protein
LDVCVRKPIIVTCGLDRTVRIWNYNTKKLECYHTFNEDPYSVAIHPSGFHIIVGFQDKLRMLNVFNSTIKQYKELPIKSCREIKFSHGGHLFAIAHGLLIQVYNFYTAECP